MGGMGLFLGRRYLWCQVVGKRLEFRFQARNRDSGELDEVDGNGASAQARDADVAARCVAGRVHHVALGSFAARADLDEGLGLEAQPGGDLPLEDGLVVDADVGDEARLVELEEDPLLGVGGGGPVGAEVGLQHVGGLLPRRLAGTRLHPETQSHAAVAPLLPPAIPLPLRRRLHAFPSSLVRGRDWLLYSL